MSQKEQLLAEPKFLRTKLQDRMVYPEKTFSGSKKDPVTFESRYESIPTTISDPTISAAYIGTTFVSDASHNNEVVDSYTDIAVYHDDQTLRANVMAVADGFGHYGDLNLIADAANKISYAFSNYMAANIAVIEDFIRQNDKEGFKAFVKKVVKKVHETVSTNLEETAALACTVMLNIDGKFYHVSVNIGDGVVWAIDRDNETVTSLVRSVNAGFEGEEATPPAFHTILMKQNDKISKNPLDFDEDIMCDFGEISPNTILFVGSDAQMEPLMDEVKETDEFVASPIEGEKGRYRFRYALSEKLGKQLYKKLNLKEQDNVVDVIKKLFNLAIDFVNEKRKKEDVNACGDDHTGIAKDVSKAFQLSSSLNFAEEVPECLELVDQDSMSEYQLLLPLKDFVQVHGSANPAGLDVARFWNKGMKVNFGPQGGQVHKVIKQNIVEWTKNWSDPEQSELIKKQLIDLKNQAASDFEGIDIPINIDRNDLDTGYIFAIFSQTQYSDEVVGLQNPSVPGYQQNAENNKEMVLFLQRGEQGLRNKAMKKSVELLKNYAQNLVLGGQASKTKGEATLALVQKIYDAKENLDEIKKLVDSALKSEYRNLHQTNKCLVNRGPFHLYWFHSLIHKKVNTVSGRLSRSTTEDYLIDIKKFVDAAIECRDENLEKKEEVSSSQSFSSE